MCYCWFLSSILGKGLIGAHWLKIDSLLISSYMEIKVEVNMREGKSLNIDTFYSKKHIFILSIVRIWMDLVLMLSNQS